MTQSFHFIPATPHPRAERGAPLPRGGHAPVHMLPLLPVLSLAGVTSCTSSFRRCVARWPGQQRRPEQATRAHQQSWEGWGSRCAPWATCCRAQQPREAQSWSRRPGNRGAQPACPVSAHTSGGAMELPPPPSCRGRLFQPACNRLTPVTGGNPFLHPCPTLTQLSAQEGLWVLVERVVLRMWV